MGTDGYRWVQVIYLSDLGDLSDLSDLSGTRIRVAFENSLLHSRIVGKLKSLNKSDTRIRDTIK